MSRSRAVTWWAVNDGQSTVAGSRIPGAARRLLRRLPGLPRRHDRQRRLPVDPGVVPRHDRSANLSWVLNAYNIVFAAFLIVFGRLTDLLGRRRAFVAGVAVFTVASVLCGPRRPSSSWWPPGWSRRSVPRCSSPPRSRWWSRPSPRSGAPTRSASGAPPPPSRPVSGRRSAVPWSSSAAGAGPSWSTCRSAWWPSGSRAASSSRAGHRAVAGCPTCVGAALLAAALGAAQPGHHQGHRLGLGQRRRGRVLRRGAALLASLFVISSRRPRSPLLDPALLRLRSFSVGSLATIAAGFGFFAYLLTNILWLQYVWQYSVIQAGLALVPGALVAAVVAAASVRSPTGTATAGSSSRARWSGPARTSGTTSWWGSTPRSGPSGSPARCSAASASERPAAARQRRAGRRTRAGGTRPPRPWCRARVSSAACWASRCSW